LAADGKKRVLMFVAPAAGYSAAAKSPFAMQDDRRMPRNSKERAAVEKIAAAAGEHGVAVESCANCTAPMIGAYCAVCGQERESHRRSIFGLVHNLFEEIVSFDSRILRTARALVVRPGELSLAFQQGRSRRYVPALRLYLFVSLLFFLVLDATRLAIVQVQVTATPAKIVTDGGGHKILSANGPMYVPDCLAKEPGPHYSATPQVHFFGRIGDFQNHIPASALASLDRDLKHGGRSNAGDKLGGWITSRVLHTLDAVAINPAAVNGPLTEWIPRVLFVLLPLYALLLAIFYWRQRRKFYFIDHLVFSLHVHSFVFVAILAAVGLAQVVPAGTAAWAALTAIGLYILLAIRRFYRQNWFWTCTKFATISAFYTLFFLLPAIAVIFLFSLLEV